MALENAKVRLGLYVMYIVYWQWKRREKIDYTILSTYPPATDHIIIREICLLHLFNRCVNFYSLMLELSIEKCEIIWRNIKCSHTTVGVVVFRWKLGVVGGKRSTFTSSPIHRASWKVTNVSNKFGWCNFSRLWDMLNLLVGR